MDTTPAAPLPSRGFKSTLFVRQDFGVMLSNRLKVHVPFSGSRKPVKRGKVKGFSFHAATRLRNFLFSLDYPGLFSPAPCFGLALTCPPWVACSVEEVFDSISKHKTRCPGLLGLVWRKEVTRKGQPHYHLIVWSDGNGDCRKWLIDAWCKRLEKHVCPVRLYLPNPKLWEAAKAKGKPPSYWCSGWLRFVHESSRNLTWITSATAVQYLCDHTSKHKRYQANTVGRAWGVWNKDALPRVPLAGVDLDKVPLNVLARIQRALGKMSRYWYKSDKSPFGYRWSRARGFRSMGRHALFRPGAALAVRRLLAYYCPSLPLGAGDGADAGGRLRRAAPEPKRGGFTEFTPRAGNLQSNVSAVSEPAVAEDVSRAPFLPGIDPSCITCSYSPQMGDEPFLSRGAYNNRRRPKKAPKWRLTLHSRHASINREPCKGSS